MYEEHSNNDIDLDKRKKLIIVGLFGFFGAFTRYLIYQAFDFHTQAKSYHTTIIVNILGAFILSFLISLNLDHRQPSFYSKHRNEILSGFVGSFSTFSTMIFDISEIYNSGSKFSSIFYFTVSISIGLVMIIIGKLLGTRVNEKHLPKFVRNNIIDQWNQEEETCSL